jgi:C6 transcription factor Pro1
MVKTNNLLTSHSLGVPEIVSTIDNIIKHIQTISASHFDRAMILPFVLAGCLSEDPYTREMIRQRLQWHHDDFYNGSMSQARTFVEYVHSRRQAARNSHHRANVNVDWRECMCERWSAITLV